MAMTSIEQMVSDQPGLKPQVTGALTHVRLWAATIFTDKNCDYRYAHLMRGTSAGETIWSKEAYGRL